jgi:hypothetical protein
LSIMYVCLQYEYTSTPYVSTVHTVANTDGACVDIQYSNTVHSTGTVVLHTVALLYWRRCKNTFVLFTIKTSVYDVLYPGTVQYVW